MFTCVRVVCMCVGAEEKVLDAAAAIRALNPSAAIIFYFAVDYTRTWYDLGVWFDAHPKVKLALALMLTLRLR